MPYTARQIANALRSQESGGSSDPNITNKSAGSGARGPWQIMPSNWASWAKAAGLPSDAPWTLDNQEKVVMAQIQGHLDHGYTPQDIAAIWYSGQPLGKNADASQRGGPSIRAYSNSVMAKLGGGMSNTSTSTRSTTSASAKSAADSADFKQFMAGIGNPQPDINDPAFEDQPGTKADPATGQGAVAGRTRAQLYANALSQWNTEASKYFPSFVASRTAAAKGEYSQDQLDQNATTNYIALLNAQVNAGTLDAQTAAAKLTAFIGEQKNALDMTQQQLTANDQMDKYGPGGNWTTAQLGGSFAQKAKEIGADPNVSGMNFKTPTPFDVAGNYAKNIATMGGGDGPPGDTGPSDISQMIQDYINGETDKTETPPATIAPYVPSLPGAPTDPGGFPGGVMPGNVPTSMPPSRLTIQPQGRVEPPPLPGSPQDMGGLPGGVMPQFDQNGRPITPPPHSPYAIITPQGYR